MGVVIGPAFLLAGYWIRMSVCSNMGRKEMTWTAMADLSIRIDFGPDLRVGPGKIALLEQIAALGSISAGGRAMDMSYRRAWELIEELNSIFGKPVVESRSGGRKGGGATLTPLGLSLISRYRAMERAAAAATAPHLAALSEEIASAAG